MKIKILILMLLITLLLAGCATIEKLLPSASPQPSGTVLFADDFSSPKGWGTLGRSGGSISFDYQGLIISVDMPNFLFWTVNGKKYPDAVIDVDAVLLSGPTNDNFGVICRFADNNNFYGFVLSHDGYYGIFKMKDGKIIPLLSPTAMQYSDEIRQGGVVNHIQAICSGTTLTLGVNDKELTSIEDFDFQTGQIGLLGGAYDQAGVQLFFDNLVVTQP